MFQSQSILVLCCFCALDKSDQGRLELITVNLSFVSLLTTDIHVLSYFQELTYHVLAHFINIFATRYLVSSVKLSAFI